MLPSMKLDRILCVVACCALSGCWGSGSGSEGGFDFSDGPYFGPGDLTLDRQWQPAMDPANVTIRVGESVEILARLHPATVYFDGYDWNDSSLGDLRTQDAGCTEVRPDQTRECTAIVTGLRPTGDSEAVFFNSSACLAGITPGDCGLLFGAANVTVIP
jgi:hypothetical protein